MFKWNKTSYTVGTKTMARSFNMHEPRRPNLIRTRNTDNWYWLTTRKLKERSLRLVNHKSSNKKRLYIEKRKLRKLNKKLKKTKKRG